MLLFSREYKLISIIDFQCSQINNTKLPLAIQESQKVPEKQLS